MPHDELIFGLHAVMAVLEREPGSLRGIWVEHRRRDPRMRNLLEKARRHGVTVYQEDRSRLDGMSGGGRHQGVLARRIVSTPVRDERALPEILATTREPALVAPG